METEFGISNISGEKKKKTFSVVCRGDERMQETNHTPERGCGREIV